MSKVVDERMPRTVHLVLSDGRSVDCDIRNMLVNPTKDPMLQPGDTIDLSRRIL